jgi:uncharacterized membrane protein
MLRQGIRLCLVPVIAGLVVWSGGRASSTLSAASQIVSVPTTIGLGGTYGNVYSISATGYVFGASQLPGDVDYHRFLRKPTGETFDLGPVHNDGGVVSNNGFVAATLPNDPQTGASHGGFWSEATGWIVIPGIPQRIEGTIEPGDRTNVFSVSVNSSGTVVGVMTSIRPSTWQWGEQVLFKWTRAEGMVALASPLDNRYAEFYGFNEAGQLAGTLSAASDGDHAFRWSAAEGFVDLGTFPGHDYRLRAFGISEAGQVVGFQYFPESNIDMPFSWTPQSGLVSLFPATTQYNYGLGVNTRGQVVGQQRRPGGGWEYDSFFMDSLLGAVQTIPGGLYGGSPALGLGSRAMNGSGQVVGQQYGNVTEAFYWSAADGLVGLGAESQVKGISETGLIAGRLDGRPVIWQAPAPAKADSTPPTVTLTSPIDGQLYETGDAVIAQYSCGDESELVVCAASVPSGAALTAAQPGWHTFTVTAIDRYDNVTQRSVTYRRPDHLPPAVTVNLADGAGLEIGQAFVLEFSCTDDTEVTVCGPATVGAQQLQSGFPLPTNALGTYTINIPARDALGNETTVTRTYTVSPRLAAAITSPVSGSSSRPCRDRS